MRADERECRIVTWGFSKERKRDTGDMYGVVWMVWIALDSLWAG